MCGHGDLVRGHEGCMHEPGGLLLARASLLVGFAARSACCAGAPPAQAAPPSPARPSLPAAVCVVAPCSSPCSGGSRARRGRGRGAGAWYWAAWAETAPSATRRRRAVRLSSRPRRPRTAPCVGGTCSTGSAAAAAPSAAAAVAAGGRRRPDVLAQRVVRCGGPTM
eukprot:352454-Chlamydomonas_euryale.AAC.14